MSWSCEVPAPAEGLPWYRRRGSRRRKQCATCGILHCFWCGGPLDIGAAPGAPLAPSREHLKRCAVVVAHALCNNRRGLDAWIPYHEIGEWPPRQIDAAISCGLASLAMISAHG